MASLTLAATKRNGSVAGSTPRLRPGPVGMGIRSTVLVRDVTGRYLEQLSGSGHLLLDIVSAPGAVSGGAESHRAAAHAPPLTTRPVECRGGSRFSVVRTPWRPPAARCAAAYAGPSWRRWPGQVGMHKRRHVRRVLVRATAASCERRLGEANVPPSALSHAGSWLRASPFFSRGRHASTSADGKRRAALTC
jgi:hypothetical protein